MPERHLAGPCDTENPRITPIQVPPVQAQPIQVPQPQVQPAPDPVPQPFPPQGYALAQPAVPAQPAPGQQPGPGMSRRNLLRIAGTAGVVAAAAGGAAAYFATSPGSTAGTAPTTASGAVMTGPIVVYVSDTKTGEMDVFAGTSQTKIRNSALVAQLVHSMR